MDSNSPDLVGNTGANDPNSAWGSGLLQTAESAGSAVINALANQTPVTAPGSSAPGKSGAPSTFQKYLVPVLVVVGIIVAVMFLRRK